jgi:hypothetical protein
VSCQASCSLTLPGLGLVVGKLFVSDMADLSSGLRALSFIGLGAVLVGIGYAGADRSLCNPLRNSLPNLLAPATPAKRPRSANR